MKIYEFVHEGKLLNLNEALNMKARSSFLYNKNKQQTEEDIMWSIKSQLRGLSIADKPFSTVFTWFVSSRRSDPDNVASAVKYIFDAAQKCGFIKNDNYLATSGGFMHRFVLSPDRMPRVHVQFLVGGKMQIIGIADDNSDKELIQEWTLQKTA